MHWRHAGELGQDRARWHFLASLYVCDTIEGLRLVYYDWLFDLTTFIQASVYKSNFVIIFCECGGSEKSRFVSSL
jgi:acetone carboxylase gamma subunit